jgi:rhodanese-related sulfurtransferase
MNASILILIAGIIIISTIFIFQNMYIDTDIVEEPPLAATEYLNNPEYLIIDVREKYEFNSEHIANSINFPLSKLRTEYKSIPNNKKILLVCKSGARSRNALSFLKDQGYDDLINLKGGLDAWKRNRLKLQ